MRKQPLSSDSLAMIMLCTNLAIPKNFNKNKPIKPLTLAEWNRLTPLLAKSSMGSPRAFLETDSSEWKKELLMSDEQVDRYKSLLSRGASLAIELERLYRMGIWVTTRAEKSYPKQLKKKLKQKAPVVLYGAGDIDILKDEGIAIVGSRDVDEEGSLFTQKLATRCADEAITVVSGGARGVDQTAQQFALNNGGRAIAILSNGLESSIKNREIREAILSGRLLLLSENHPKGHFTVYSAMGRNKYIYALSKGAVVVSSTVDKGGTWAGAIENLKSKWVPLIVRSDDHAPAGNQRLLEMGGSSLRSYDLENDQFVLRDWLATLEDNFFIDEGYSKNKSNPLSNNLKSKQDIYHIVCPFIEELLTTEKNSNELSAELNVQQSQMEEWLERAVKEGKIIKNRKSNRYEVNSYKNNQLKSYEQISLFDTN